MRKLDTSKWNRNPRIPQHEDLLLEYCCRRGGTTFSNAKLEGDPYPNHRQIDGIRFPSRSRRLISWSRRDSEDFEKLLARAQRDMLPVEAIEVTPGKSSRYEVGQVVIAGWLLKQLKVKAAMVIVCGEANSELEAFLSEHGIRLCAQRKRPTQTH
jgi:hypothetical protein